MELYVVLHLYAQLGKADGLEMDEFMLKYNIDPYGANAHPCGESDATMAGFGLSQADMLASRNRLEVGQESTDACTVGRSARVAHGAWWAWRRPPMSTHVASAQLAQVDEVVQPKRQRHAVPDPHGELSSQGVWFRRCTLSKCKERACIPQLE